MWSIVGTVVICLAALVAAAAPSSAGTTVTTLGITSSPSLYPAFDPIISDYVIRCDPGESVQVSVNVPTGYEAFVNGGGGHTSSFTTPVNLLEGQAFSVTVLNLSAGSGSTYHARCLPTDYPNFTSQKPGTPQAEYYLTTAMYPAMFSPGTPVENQYPTIWSNDGVPVWWMPMHKKTLNMTLLPNGDVAFIGLQTSVAEEFDLNGKPVRSLELPGSGVEVHELQLLPNGNFLTASNRIKPHVNLAFMGGPTDVNMWDVLIVEATPSGHVVWSWLASDHIDVHETAAQWYDYIVTSGDDGRGYDNIHFNSAEMRGDKVLLSFRHLDAVYEVDKATGDIVYKLGGTTTSKSLAVVDDPVFTDGGSFAGQHDARYFGEQPDQVTIHDNGTGKNRAPRAVRYAIDRAGHKATLVESVTDSLAPSSGCCGSARKLSTGNWLAAWGFNTVVSEVNTAGEHQAFINWTDAGFGNYRAEPVMPGILSRNALRSAMDTRLAG
ncbi:MAG: hypothetical protein QOK43_3161 [Acidimicrobiaceae bacterium]|nr:hypothetical protein [Acidimicrobiaceae bacterium]